MTDTTFLDLLASYEAALDGHKRTLAITRALPDGLLADRPPPVDVVRAYALQVDHNEAQLVELREKVLQFKAGSGRIKARFL